MTPRSIIKYSALSVVFVLAVWALWPPPEPTDADSGSSGDPGATGPIDSASDEVEYTIKFYPGNQYMPDSVPFGIGQPLQGIQQVIRDFERLHPDTHIEVVTVPGVREYLVTQLSSGNAPDILMVNVEDVWIDVQKGWYVPLDSFLEAPNPFVVEAGDPAAPGYEQWWDMFKYQAITRGKAAPNGKSYCISLDMVETAIFYNKDMFRDVGAKVPETWSDFMGLLTTFEDYRNTEGETVTPLVLHIFNLTDWATDLFFDQLYYPILDGIDLLKDPAREGYMQGYLDWDEITFLFDQGFFTRADPRYTQIWRVMHEMVGHCNRDLSTTDMIREFVTRRGAMIWSSSPMVYRLWGDKSLDFEWDVFYLPPFDRSVSEFADGHPMCVIGGVATQYEVTNSALRDTDPSLPMAERMAQSERLQRTMAFLQFLTMPANCERVVNEYPSFLANIVGVDVLEPLQPFDDILARRYTTTKWDYTFDLKFSEIQRRMLELYLTDGITLDEFLDKWQIPNIAAATANVKMRKNPDLERLEREWERLAPVRARMVGMPEPPPTSDTD